MYYTTQSVKGGMSMMFFRPLIIIPAICGSFEQQTGIEVSLYFLTCRSYGATAVSIFYP